MTNIKYYLVSADRCDYRSISLLNEEEQKSVICYSVNPSIQKTITDKIQVINEWELSWHSNRYQALQYYEYGLFAHAIKNPELLEGLTHIGLLHYDVRFQEDSVNYHHEYLEMQPDTIFYNTKRQNNQLYFNRFQFNKICEFLEERLDININKDKVWNDGWYSEALSITPIDVFKKFGEFFVKYQYEIEGLLNFNKWQLMDSVKHRLCGFSERLWGIYLMSIDMSHKEMLIDHEHGLYKHLHLQDKQKFLNKL